VFGIHFDNSSPQIISENRIINNASDGIKIANNSNPLIGGSESGQNNIYNNGGYNVSNYTVNNITATHNYWGITDSAGIQATIYDHHQNPSYGYVYFSPWAGSAVPPPTLVSPPDSAIISDNTPEFTWSATAGEGGSYTLEYALNNLFTSGVVTISGLSDTIYTVFSELTNTTYYWHVEAITQDGLHSGYQQHPSMFTISQPYDISGNVFYYYDSSYVDSVTMTVSGYISDSVLTDNVGYYIFTDLPGSQNYNVIPSKKTTLHPDPAISSYDAALVLQHTAGLNILNGNQQVAGDVSGNSSISSYDAALILQYTVGYIDSFPVGADWVFNPASRSYTPLNDNQSNQDYLATLYGDVSGNWAGSKGSVLADRFKDELSAESRALNIFIHAKGTDKESITTFSREIMEKRSYSNTTSSAKSTPKAGIKSGSKQVSVNVPDVAGMPGDAVIIPINVSDVTELGIISADITLSFDGSILTPLEASLGDVVPSGWLIQSNPADSQIVICMAGANPLGGSGTLVTIPFVVDSIASNGDTTTIHFAEMRFNEGNVPANPNDGLFTVMSSAIETCIPDTSGGSGETVIIPISVSDVTELGIISADITLSFDGSILTALEASLGDVVPSGWLIVSNPGDCQVVISIAGANPLSGSGTLVTIPFVVDSMASNGDTTTIHFAEMRFNEGNVPVHVQDGIFTVALHTEIVMIGSTIPKVFSLNPNYPNPFNNSTKVPFQLPKPAFVNLSVYNIRGELVNTLVNEYKKEGYYSIEWDAIDVGSGVYLFKINAGEYSAVRKCLIIK
jgi:hypothetical protein